MFALPLALQFGIKHEVVHVNDNGVGLPSLLCTLTNPITYSFEISTVVFFIIPACLLTVLYIKIGVHLRRSEKCITRQHVNNTQHSQSNLSPNESLLLATINAPPSSPNSNACPIVVDFSNPQQQHKLKQNRSNSGEANVLKSSLIRKMVRSCSNLSLLSSLSLKLNLQSSQMNTQHPNSQLNLHQINSQPNFQSSQSTLNEQLRKANSSTNSIKQSADSQLIANNNNNLVDSTTVTIEGEKGGVEESSTRNKLISRLRNVIEEKDGEELDEEVAEQTAMLAKEDTKQSDTIAAKTVNIPHRSVEQLKGESRDASLNSKRKQYQRTSPFSTLDSSSSNGWSRMAGLPPRANTTLHSQDSSTSLNIRRRNWRFFNRTHSTRTIHHSSSSRRAVVKMLGEFAFSLSLLLACPS